MRRHALSRPLRTALDDGLVGPDTTVMDYGCGRGGDVRMLASIGVDAVGWDPAHASDGIIRPSDVVNLGYVVNVIEDERERRRTIREAFELARRVLIVSARLQDEAPLEGRRHRDGIVTRIGTFQRFYEQQELRTWIDDALGVRSIAAAPGVFYVFVDEASRASHLALRVSARNRGTARVVPAPDAAVLVPLSAFMATRGRTPDPAELPGLREIAVQAGGLARAIRLASEMVPDLPALRAARSDDLLAMLALSRFDGRPRFSDLPTPLQYDIRSFFGSHAAACATADHALGELGGPDRLDDLCQASPFGKLMPTALYVALDAVADLPLGLRLYEGCARGYAGAVPDADVVKFARDEPKVSYLAYGGLHGVAHPALISSTVVHLRELTVRTRRYEARANPPILHRKELLLQPSHPRRPTYARLTASEERHGLFDDPSAIGLARGWGEALARAGLELRGHRLARSKG